MKLLAVYPPLTLTVTPPIDSLYFIALCKVRASWSYAPGPGTYSSSPYLIGMPADINCLGFAFVGTRLVFEIPQL